jgi:hypothetical protein
MSLVLVLVHWPHISLSHQMSSVVSVSWCGLCGLRVPREGWDGIPVLNDVYGYNLVKRSVRTGCVGRSEVFGWSRTRAHLLWYGALLTGIAVWLNKKLLRDFDRNYLSIFYFSYMPFRTVFVSSPIYRGLKLAKTRSLSTAVLFLGNQLLHKAVILRHHGDD